MRARLFTGSFSLGVCSLVFAACSGTAALSESSFDASDGAFESSFRDPSDAPVPTFDEAGWSPPDGSPEFACYTATYRETCRGCCQKLYPQGYAVFTNAIDECICQPSKCGSQCAASLCGTPQTQPQKGDACDKCFADKLGPTDGAANPPLDASAGDGGGAYPERGIANCSAWASDKCRASAACREEETCKDRSRCLDKPSSRADAGSGGG